MGSDPVKPSNLPTVAPSGASRDEIEPASSNSPSFRSILFQESHVGLSIEEPEPSFFQDLNLGGVIDAITAGWKDRNLKPFFYVRLNSLDAILYRQEVMRDLEDKVLRQAIVSFSEHMRAMRVRFEQVKKVSYYKYVLERRFLGAVEIYCEAVEQLSQNLISTSPTARAFVALSGYLAEYIASDSFRTLAAQARRLTADLAAIKYLLLIRDGSVAVQPYEAESDYSTIVEDTFSKFRHESSGGYALEIPKWEGVNHVENQILYRVALLHPDPFKSLDDFFNAHADYLDATIARFEWEVQFYLSFLTYMEKFRRTGLHFCQPQMSQTSKEIRGCDCFDIALADKLIREKGEIITNDFFLKGAERVFVVSGPNQGGKTTFARMIGQLHYFASIGCSVPGTEAQLFLVDNIFTHFERQESIATLHGKLQDDLIRIHQILTHATRDSLIVMNEMFSSTTLHDAVYLSKKVMETVSSLDGISVWVTFLDELASFNEKTVSIVSKVNADNPAIRTFKLERQPANGLAYALAVAQKYHVTYNDVKRRVKG